MNIAQLETTTTKNARLVPMEPQVKSSETCKLFNAGALGMTGSTKSTDPTCYTSLTADEVGLFENMESKMQPLWNKGDVVTIFQMHPSKGLLVEGRATVVKALDRSMEHYMVRFHRKDGKPEREAYERFIDRGGQTDPAAYIKEFNARIGYAA